MFSERTTRGMRVRKEWEMETVTHGETSEETPQEDPQHEPGSPESPAKEPETQPPGESPQSPEPETEQPDKGDEGEASVPENATRAGRKRAAKPASGKKRSSSSQKKGSAGEQAEYDRLIAQQKDKGYTSAMAKKVRDLAGKLGKTPPKWAQAKGGSDGDAQQKRADDPDLQLAHEATAYATDGKVVDNKVIVGDTKFGAPVTARQVQEVRAYLKGKDILKHLHVSEAKLSEYARGKIKATDLPDEARAALKEMNASFDPKLKMWARKDAVIALFIHRRERKAKQKKAAPQKEAVAA
jgi:hypothetical protein